jgi:hypothetical protein
MITACLIGGWWSTSSGWDQVSKEAPAAEAPTNGTASTRTNAPSPARELRASIHFPKPIAGSVQAIRDTGKPP